MTDGLSGVAVLKCPSCGSSMGSPDLQGIATCSYCGTKIVLPPTESHKELRNLGRFKELCQAERRAKNWGNLLNYAGAILEINPGDVDAWLDKALATGSLSSYLVPRYDEAVGYLERAAELSPDDPRINEIRTIIRDIQFNAYTSYAFQLNQQALDMKKLGSTGRDYAVRDTLESMAYLLLAHKVKPDDPVALESIYNVKENGLALNIRWNDEVFEIVAKARQLKTQRESQQAAAYRLTLLRQKLKLRQDELEKLKQKKSGFFVKMEIEDIQTEIKNLMLEITKLEAATQP